MRFRQLFRLNNTAPGAWVLLTVMWFAEQRLSLEEFWTQIPFGWLAIVAFAFWMGQDFYHPDGRLRQFIRRIRWVAEFAHPACRVEYLNLGDHHGGKLKVTGIYVPLTFPKSLSLRAIRIRSEIYRYQANKLGGEIGSYDWVYKQNSHFLPDQTIEIPIAFIPEDKSQPGLYADRKKEGYLLGAMTAHFITIELFKRTTIQSKTLQILIPGNQPSFDPPDKVESGGRFFLFEDGQLPNHND